MYQTRRITKTVKTKDYFSKYVDINQNLSYCRTCQNYDKNWACPELNFEPEIIWKKYKNFDIIAIQVIFDESDQGKECTGDELKSILKRTVGKEKQRLFKEVLSKESNRMNALAITPLQCKVCDGCNRLIGEKCMYPNKSRNSLEALGGDIGRTASEILGENMFWIENNIIPKHYLLIGGVLY